MEVNMGNIVIIMGSKADKAYAGEIKQMIESMGSEAVLRVASAHKTPEKVLGIIRTLEPDVAVFITVAGMSNALSGFVDANTVRPVIACPPGLDEFGGMDILSSLRMPSGVAPMTVLGAKQGALAALKIAALGDEKISLEIAQLQKKNRDRIEKDDAEVENG
jgi:5-(carboxyamino)imidazole ribonucleotide mutase